MFPFSQVLTPAMRAHMDAQTAYLNDLSQAVFRSCQQMCELHIQLVRTLVEESTLAGQQLLGAERHGEAIGAASSRALPASEKLRAYLQHIARLAADAQVELASVTGQHVQNTSRTARALVDEVARTAAEETGRGIRNQQEALRSAADPLARPNGAADPGMRGNGEQGRGHAAAGQGRQGGRAGRATH